ncbi:MAG: N-acetylneuraminate synthase [Verrucomicrobia bacterium]|nr:N-acetylneuraminate synthase [Verrucomicrobiota bacterium]
MMNPPLVIAEIGCNHRGSLETAFELIKIASIYCDVDAVKFQKRNPRELLSPEQYSAPHPNPANAYGKTYGEHRENLEFSLDQHRQLKAYCEEMDVIYSTSVWDLTSAKEIASLKPQFIKIPSACNLNFEMLGWLADNYDGDLHISFGMTTHEEEEKVVRFFEQKRKAKNLVIYSCTSGYPVSFEDICLLEITRLKNTFDSRVKEIAFSGHHLGIAADIAAMTLGARWIERHYTLDRTWKGTDHAASLEPDGLRRLVRDARNVAHALNAKKTEMLECELVQRAKLKRTY